MRFRSYKISGNLQVERQVFSHVSAWMHIERAEQSRYLLAQDGSAAWRERAVGTLPAGYVRVSVRCSGVSVGTELETLRRSAGEGNAEPGILGYQASGVVHEVGADVSEYEQGTYVACYGGPYVHHARWLDVPRHLIAPFSAPVTFEDGAYCGSGTIALHAFRSTGAGLGEVVVVIGLGMLGNLIAQVARAAGCRVFCAETIDARRDALEKAGIPAYNEMAALKVRVMRETTNHGADAVIIAANACNDELLGQACHLVRRNGCVAIAGLSDARIPREALFQKEARLVVPRAGGPGRYDAQYEAGGIDYPYDLARWTEHRNLLEFVRLLRIGAISISGLYDVASVSDAANCYSRLANGGGTKLGVVFDWRRQDEMAGGATTLPAIFT